jgi:hypothetical protein
MFFTFAKKVLMQIPYKRILKLEVSQDVSETARADLSLFAIGVLHSRINNV